MTAFYKHLEANQGDESEGTKQKNEILHREMLDQMLEFRRVLRREVMDQVPIDLMERVKEPGTVDEKISKAQDEIRKLESRKREMVNAIDTIMKAKTDSEAGR